MERSNPAQVRKTPRYALWRSTTFLRMAKPIPVPSGRSPGLSFRKIMNILSNPRELIPMPLSRSSTPTPRRHLSRTLACSVPPLASGISGHCRSGLETSASFRWRCQESWEVDPVAQLHLNSEWPVRGWRAPRPAHGMTKQDAEESARTLVRFEVRPSKGDHQEHGVTAQAEGAG